MGFRPMKLKPESGANRIKSADDAYSFMVHMRLSYQNKPHWQVARQAINQACMSEASEIRAWRSSTSKCSTFINVAGQKRNGPSSKSIGSETLHHDVAQGSRSLDDFAGLMAWLWVQSELIVAG